MTGGRAPTPSRIAVFRALYLGDLITAVPALRALRRCYPAAEITFIGLPWAASFAQRFHRYIDRFVEFPGYPGINEVAVDEARTSRFLAEERAHGYDLAIQMHGSGESSNPFVLALGAARTAGYYRGEVPLDLTVAAPYPAGGSEVLRNLALVRLLGCDAADTHLEFPLFPADRAEASALLANLPHRHGGLIGLHPGSKSPSRRWPAGYFAAAADDLARRFGARILLTGGPGEEDLVDDVAGRMAVPAFLTTGKTSLGGLAALIASLDLFVSNDTGPSWIAQAVDTPSVVVMGPTEYDRWAPLDQRRHIPVRHPVACSPCMHWECPIDHRCLRRVTPARVVAAAAKLLTLGVAA